MYNTNMNTIKLPLLLSLSYLSNGMIKYQCPHWLALYGLTQSRDKINWNIELFIQKMVNSGNGSLFSSLSSMTPESFWYNQSKDAKVGSAVLNLAVNGDPFRRKIPDEELYPITIYYLYWDEAEDYVQIWIPIISEYTRVERNSDSVAFQESVKFAIQKLLLGATNGDWRMTLIAAGHVRKVECGIWNLSIDFPLMSENAVKIYADSQERVIVPEEAGLTAYVGKPSDSITGFEEQLVRMHEALFMPRPTSVLIVGESGAGKTALWDKFVQSVRENKPDYRCYQTNAVALIVNNGDGEWTPTKRLDLLVEFAGKNKGVYYLGNLWELDQAGKYYKQPLSLADFITPHLERGTLGVVVECNQEQYAQIEKNHPGLIRLFEVIQLEPAGEKETRAILKNWTARRCKGRFSAAALDKIVSLYQRYSFYEALPGAAVKFLDLLITRYNNEKKIEKNQVVEFFSLQTGLPQFLLDESIPFNREETAQFFASRVIGQGSAEEKTENALNAVTGLMETIKAGLSRQNGPIASLLFIGPTGVGKTEMAKAIAEYLFNDPRRMIRIDMSEYSDILAAQRLINGTEQGEGILTSQVRMQPFGVVLLDEFEKADPAVFDLLLQVLGEGRLTDAKGRLANFSNCVIILTSNLGVSDFGKKSLTFTDAEEKSSQGHFTEAVAKQVRPELINRIDKIVPFNALSKPVLRAILDKELKRIEKRLGVKYRKLKLNFDEPVLNKLVELGYNPQYGARPLKRTVEQYILTPLANFMANKTALSVDNLRENNAHQSYSVHFSLKKKNSAKSEAAPEEMFSISVKTVTKSKTESSKKTQNISQILFNIRHLIRDVETVTNCSYVQQLQSDAFYSIQHKSLHGNPVCGADKLLRRMTQIHGQILGLERKTAFDYLAHDIIPDAFDLTPWQKEYRDFLVELLSFKKNISVGKKRLFVWGDDENALALFWNVIKTMLEMYGGEFTMWGIVQCERGGYASALRNYMKNPSGKLFYPVSLWESNGKVKKYYDDIRKHEKEITRDNVNIIYGVNDDFQRILGKKIGFIVEASSPMAVLYLNMMAGIHSIRISDESDKIQVSVGMEYTADKDDVFPDEPETYLGAILARSGGRRFSWSFGSAKLRSFGKNEVRVRSSLDSDDECNSFCFLSENINSYFEIKLMQYIVNEILYEENR